MKMTEQEFRDSIIGQDDCGEYDESGYVAGIHKGVAFIASYSHCSCYDTFSGLCGGGIGDYMSEGTLSVDWSGTPEELLDMAVNKRDINLPIRDCYANDCDSVHAQTVYQEIIDYFKE